MRTEPEWIAKPSLNKTELGEHLAVSCSKTLNRILRKIELEPAAGGYPWRRIFRAVHRTEGFLLPGHLAELKARHGTPALDEINDDAERADARAMAQGSPILDDLEDLEAALRVPLWPFARMAREIGCVPDTLSKALRQGRAPLPFPALQLGPRLRLYRPLEVRLWRDDGVLLDLPPAMRIVSETRPEAAVASGATAGMAAPAPADGARKAVFGGLGRGSRKNPA